MLRCLLCTLLLTVAAQLSWAGPPPDELVQKLKTVIQKHSPEAQFEVTEQGFTAKEGTMIFTVHNRSKTGEVFPTTRQEEGPNYKGFYLHVSLQPGKYEGAAVVPQTLAGPYFSTFIDGVSTDKGDHHYWVHFAYGGRLDPVLKQAILETVPRHRFGPAVPQSEPVPPKPQ